MERDAVEQVARVRRRGRSSKWQAAARPFLRLSREQRRSPGKGGCLVSARSKSPFSAHEPTANLNYRPNYSQDGMGKINATAMLKPLQRNHAMTVSHHRHKPHWAHTRGGQEGHFSTESPAFVLPSLLPTPLRLRQRRQAYASRMRRIDRLGAPELGLMTVHYRIFAGTNEEHCKHVAARLFGSRVRARAPPCGVIGRSSRGARDGSRRWWSCPLVAAALLPKAIQYCTVPRTRALRRRPPCLLPDQRDPER
ncbi:hypothetical protein OIDMADRAFT_25108 [Oidiodendron maius Zn]|uniref:Uncharacterized protein n=1 Tax=Oidiodendron maius (strain Zn) TaxID=913774 RepID=A0A0C3CZK5_OIDMZ|nr:hypothetical protein OIDMADRAFT_25108 [Oidiodendron maius Zn]